MTMVNASMLTVVPGTPLYRALQKGLYEESTEMEKMEEIHDETQFRKYREQITRAFL